MNFDFFQQANETSLTPENQQFFDGLLTKTECEEALKSMNADKTPGTDDLPAEFSKVFWDDICTHLLLPSILLTNLGASLLLKEGVLLNLFQKRAWNHFT